ncbi:tetratricopeptide repeat protein [Bacteroides heparinolyticus]|uniref:tetratricopeptide repeat protein n=1 Tax=Prevotella heparinolytica TaxID=28113 RepID=UPI0035A1D49E
MMINRIYSVLLLCLFVCCACSSDRQQVEKLFAQADSLLNIQPDSALRLLQVLPASQELSRSESARYALLLAQATDKCEKPLFPCDSLLDIALDYYDNDEKECALALLYKGRLEVEMDQSERAVDFFLKGLKVIAKFPEEAETHRHLLSSLGNEYYNANLYERAGRAYRELYKYCTAYKDKAIALNSLASYYSMTDREDSALVCGQKALEYARMAKDSATIAMSAHNLSIDYYWRDLPDTALHYAQIALQWCSDSKVQSHYSANIGKIFLDKERTDSAIYYINKSLEDSTNIRRRAAALLDLSNIKEGQGDYKTAIAYLQEHVSLIDSLYASDRSTEIQKLIHKYDIQTKIHAEKERSGNLLRNMITGFVLVCLLIILFFRARINKRKRMQRVYEERLAQTRKELSILQNSIEESQHIITLLQREQSGLMQEKEQNQKEIEEREARITKLQGEKINLRNWLFKQSAIYKKIMKLSEQKVSDKKELSVLSGDELEKLTETIFDIYADYIAEQKSRYGKLTKEDLLYLCLDKMGFSSQAISLCFGNIDTHALAQRKYRIKEKMQN